MHPHQPMSRQFFQFTIENIDASSPHSNKYSVFNSCLCPAELLEALKLCQHVLKVMVQHTSRTQFSISAGRHITQHL